MTSWQQTDFEGEPEGREASDWLMRHQARMLADAVDAWLARKAEDDKVWRAAATISDYQLHVTPDTLRALIDELDPILARYSGRPEAAPDARDVTVGLIAIPLPASGPGLGPAERRRS